MLSKLFSLKKELFRKKLLKKDFIFFALIIVLGSSFLLFKQKKTTVYFCPGFMNYQEDCPNDVWIGGCNISEFCKNNGLKFKVTRSLNNLKEGVMLLQPYCAEKTMPSKWYFSATDT